MKQETRQLQRNSGAAISNRCSRSSTSSVTSPFDSPCPLSYRLTIVTDPLSPLVSEIFDLKLADIYTYIHTYKQNSTSTDNKGRLKLSAREPNPIYNFLTYSYEV